MHHRKFSIKVSDLFLYFTTIFEFTETSEKFAGVLYWIYEPLSWILYETTNSRDFVLIYSPSSVAKKF